MPRSASRDLADRFLDPVTGRRRRYFRHWNPLERWKMYLAFFAAVLAIGWAAESFITPKFNYQASHGPVANVHAAWDSQCEACHRNAANTGILDAHARWHDFTCEKCHAAPPHSAKLKPGDAVENCGTCHHDHGGKDKSLVKLSDDHCVRCHGNLPSNTHGEAKYTNATNFATSHPEFKSLENHERHLKFSHSQHMTAGMVLVEGSQSAWTLEKLKEMSPKAVESLKQYANDKGLIQLDCKACHTLETNPASRAAGKYFQPINYDNHCAACHPTRVMPVVTAWDTVVKEFDVPHRLKPAEIKAILEQEYSAKLQGDHPELRADLKIKGGKPSSDPAIASFTAEVQKKVREMYPVVLRNGCAKCHELSQLEVDPPIDVIVPPAIRTIFMPSAKFDHTAHKATACLDCHPNAVSKIENGITRVNDREPVNIKGLASCRECHSPQGKISSNCTDCHGFHNGDHPLEGRGAEAFFAKPMSIQDFLKGK